MPTLTASSSAPLQREAVNGKIPSIVETQSAPKKKKKSMGSRMLDHGNSTKSSY